MTFDLHVVLFVGLGVVSMFVVGILLCLVSLSRRLWHVVDYRETMKRKDHE